MLPIPLNWGGKADNGQTANAEMLTETEVSDFEAKDHPVLISDS